MIENGENQSVIVKVNAVFTELFLLKISTCHVDKCNLLP